MTFCSSCVEQARGKMNSRKLYFQISLEIKKMVEIKAFLRIVYMATGRKAFSHILLRNYIPLSLHVRCFLERGEGWEFSCSSLYHLQRYNISFFTQSALRNPDELNELENMRTA